MATARERLFLNRFGTGFTQKSLAALRAAGTPETWLKTQLQPQSVAESSKVASVDSWFSTLARTPAQKYATHKAKTMEAWVYARDLANWSLLRRIYSNRSLLETMTEFWSTAVLSVGSRHDFAWPYRFDYDATIRTHALGRYEDLLVACSLHPAMRTFLDNWTSVKNAPNENQGRELLELHTVGVDAGYTEAMVKDSAKILSGYTVDWGAGRTFNAVYDPAKHTTGPVNVLGYSHANASSDGQSVAVAYLRYLAHHPATARRIATKLATYFVGDAPSDRLVSMLAGVYQSNDTDISSVLVALAGDPEFLGSEGAKVRTPYQDLVATTRVLDVDVVAPTSTSSWANAADYAHGADQLFTWSTPDGPPIVNAGWSTASRVFASYNMHQNLSGGWSPKAQATYRTPASWLPTSSLRFDRYVDHLSRQWLGRQADSRTVAIAAQAVTRTTSTTKTITASTLITPTHNLVKSLTPRLISAMLDTPEFMTT